jgi:regulator of protease activity HflC (stomatin/prohibitin superfamily)
MVHTEEGVTIGTILTTRQVSSVEATSTYFSDKKVFDSLTTGSKNFKILKKKGEQPMIVTINRSHLWASIPEGLHVITSTWGVIDKTPAKPGLMLLPFWRKIECVITNNYIPVDVPIKLCPTLDNVLIQVDVMILIHVEDPIKFYINIGPYKLQHIVDSFVEEAIRSLARTIPYYEAYDLRGMGIDDMTRSLNEKLENFGVLCSDITITDIFLPDVIFWHD